ncbi:MAG: hypothetical protein OKX56_02910 [Dehalobacter sp.]|nr:hypothetical protein [Dehalobacter sp.]MDJ0304852.1 hypothetical protein [Dehalobacter sp.]
METESRSIETQKKGRTRDLVFTLLILIFAVAHFVVMLQSVGILRADR